VLNFIEWINKFRNSIYNKMQHFNPLGSDFNEDEHCNPFAPDSYTVQHNPFASAEDEYANANPFSPAECEYENSNPFYDTPDISELIEGDAFLAWCVELSNRRMDS
jgi:hypothetical protein